MKAKKVLNNNFYARVRPLGDLPNNPFPPFFPFPLFPKEEEDLLSYLRFSSEEGSTKVRKKDLIIFPNPGLLALLCPVISRSPKAIDKNKLTIIITVFISETLFRGNQGAAV